MRRAKEAACVPALLLCAAWASADHREATGYTMLTNAVGAGGLEGAGIAVTQVEAPEAPSVYMPDAADPEFTGKSLTARSPGATNASSHATQVGRYLYGTITSMAAAITNISVFEVSDWAGDGFLRTGNLLNEPRVESNRVQNHSWVANHSDTTNLLRRLDYAIARDGFTCVAGMNNNFTTNLPQLLANAYNTITVGRSDGEHSAGLTTLDGEGRRKPDIVAPESGTSFATPIVGAAAALLQSVALTNAALTNAARPECVKALLLAGATRDEFPSWTRSPDRPLDAVYGAGELNIARSYRILAGGRHAATTTSTVSTVGWDTGVSAATTNRVYIFDVAPGSVVNRFSAALAWNREISDGIGFGFTPESTFANLDLRLHAATGLVITAELEASTSVVDNVELVVRKDLPPGRYALEVRADAATPYALAWYARPVQAPAITDFASTNDGSVAIQATGATGELYGVEAATGMTGNAWQALGTVIPMAATWGFTDTNAAACPVRFYRVRPDPYP